MADGTGTLVVMLDGWGGPIMQCAAEGVNRLRGALPHVGDAAIGRLPAPAASLRNGGGHGAGRGTGNPNGVSAGVSAVWCKAEPVRDADPTRGSGRGRGWARSVADSRVGWGGPQAGGGVAGWWGDRRGGGWRLPLEVGEAGEAAHVRSASGAAEWEGLAGAGQEAGPAGAGGGGPERGGRSALRGAWRPLVAPGRGDDRRPERQDGSHVLPNHGLPAAQDAGKKV